jgi:hypothetical protein
MKVMRRLASPWLGAVAVVVVLLSMAPGVARADTLYNPIFTMVGSIWNGTIERCLDVRKQDDYNHANARVQLWDCSGALEQQWSSRFYGLEPPAGEFGYQKQLYQIVNLRSGMCMEVREGNLSAGAQIDQYPCAGPGESIDVNAAQLWEVISPGSDSLPSYALSPWSALHAHIAMCADLDLGRTGNGTMIVQEPCDLTTARLFSGSLQSS